MPYNLAQAGAATGKSKSTILRSIRKGVISAQRVEPGGGWAIEPAELHRAFPPVANGTERNDENAELRELRARFEDAQETIRDLRARLDAEAEERRKLIAVLTDRRPWWRRWKNVLY